MAGLTFIKMPIKVGVFRYTPIKVALWNLYRGESADYRYELDTFITFMAALWAQFWGCNLPLCFIPPLKGVKAIKVVGGVKPERWNHVAGC